MPERSHEARVEHAVERRGVGGRGVAISRSSQTPPAPANRAHGAPCLEQTAHLRRRGRADRARLAISSARSGCGARERCGARFDAQRDQPFALGDHGVAVAPAPRAARLASASKSTWAVKSCSPGRRARARSVAAHSLQRVARRSSVLGHNRRSSPRRPGRETARDRRRQPASRAGEDSTISPSRSNACRPPRRGCGARRHRRAGGSAARRRIRWRRAAAAAVGQVLRSPRAIARPAPRPACASRKHRAGLDQMDRAGEARARASPAARRPASVPRPGPSST